VSARRSRLALALCVLLTTVGCDRMTKHLARLSLVGQPPQSLLGDLVRIHYVENAGGFLGIGSGLSTSLRFAVFTLGCGLLLAGVAVVALRGAVRGPREAAAWGLLLGGGLSNLADRAFHGGYVIDFLNLGVGPLRTGIFNLADVAICTAAALLFLSSRSPDRAARAEPPADAP
jgi:signal peptidase II